MRYILNVGPGTCFEATGVPDEDKLALRGEGHRKQRNVGPSGLEVCVS